MLQFDELMPLADALMLKANGPVIEKCKAELMRTPSASCIELIEKTASIVHLSDKSSIQEAIDEFIRVYGPIDDTFSKNLFVLGSSLGLLLHETSKKANYKQLFIA